MIDNSGYEIMIVNGSLKELPTRETLGSYEYTIKLATGDKKYIVSVHTYAEFLEALIVLRDLIEAGVYTIISISYHVERAFNSSDVKDLLTSLEQE